MFSMWGAVAWRLVGKHIPDPAGRNNILLRPPTAGVSLQSIYYEDCKLPIGVAVEWLPDYLCPTHHYLPYITLQGNYSPEYTPGQVDRKHLQ